MWLQVADFVSSRFGYLLVDRTGGFSRAVRWRYRERLERDREPQAVRQARQLDKLKRLLEYAGRACPYYRDLFRRLSFDPHDVTAVGALAALPVLTKATVIAERDRLRDGLRTPRELVPNASGGSTGTTVTFFQDQQYLVNQVAAALYYDSLAGWSYGARTAYLWGAPQDAGTRPWRQWAASWLTNTRGCDSFDMSDEMMERYHGDLARTRPRVMVCYAGSVYRFARFLDARGIRPNYPQHGIVSSAEVLHPHMRKTIERVFRVPVFDRYGSREVGLVAAECEAHDGLHVNTDDVIVECQRDDPTQAPGRLVITNLNTYAMPFVRYDIGDLGCLEDRACRCGRPGPLLSRVIGRTTDMFHTRSGRVMHGEYFTHLFYGMEGVAQFQFIQETLDTYRLKLVRNPSGWHDELEHVVRGKLAAVLGDAARVQVEYCDAIAPGPSGKHRFTISHVDGDARRPAGAAATAAER